MQLLFKENLARIGKFKTDHGEIETPTVMPVINPNLNFLSEKELKDLGVQAVITNSYIIRRTEKLKEYALKYGVHKLINFSGPIMTDSGTFQSYVYGDIEYNNKEIVDFQKNIGSDIITILDIFSKPDDDYGTAKNAVYETYNRLNEIDISDKIIAGPIQGSVYPDLRVISAKLMSKASYLPVGGVVPLLESYRYDDLIKIIINSKINADFSKPVHLFGGGHPMFFAFSVLLGVDLFDSASYIKYAKDNRILYTEGTRNLKEIRDFPEWSPLFGKYKPEELLRENEKTRLKELSKHNLKAIFNEITEIKERIYENTLYQYVEEKSRAHPSLYRAFIEMLNSNIDNFYNISLKSPFYFYDNSSLKNPFIKRLINFTFRYINNNKKCIVLNYKYWKTGVPTVDGIKKFYESNDYNILVQWNNIFIPLELEDTYPVSQSVSSNIIDRNYQQYFINELKKINNDIVFYDKDQISDKKIRDYDHGKIDTIFKFQFNSDISLFNGNDFIVKSKATNHIRNILRNNKILATMRNDGLFTLSINGGLALQKIKKYPLSRVIVTEDSGEFNAKGFNVFFKFIKNFDENVIAGNEVMVTDENDDLYAVGHSVVSGIEMKSYREGVAVKVHEGINKL